MKVRWGHFPGIRFLNSRRGSEIVEAAVVMPLVILAVLSMILLQVFFYQCLLVQVRLHEDLTDRAVHSRKLFCVEQASASRGENMQGITHIRMTREHRVSCYAFCGADLVRTGEVTGLGK